MSSTNMLKLSWNNIQNIETKINKNQKCVYNQEDYIFVHTKGGWLEGNLNRIEIEKEEMGSIHKHAIFSGFL